MKPHLFITSFQRSHGIHAPKFSAAVYQPKGYDYPKADWTDIRDASGAWTRPRNFITESDPLKAYADALRSLYESRREQALAWLEALAWEYHSGCLCCWCPYDRAAQRQLGEWGSFVCHTAILAEKLEEWGYAVWLDTDRQLMKKLPA